MTIFINPDRHKESISKVLETVDCPGLEELTGCDLCLSDKPIKPTKDLDWHIEHNSIFIQVKAGYDIFSFDALKSTASRLQQVKVSKRNSYVLFIGRCYPDNEGRAVIDGKQYGRYTYHLFEELQGLIESRCCHFRQIPTIDQLPTFTDALLVARDKIAKEGGREHYEGGKTQLIDDPEPLQDIITVEKTSPRYVLVNGLDGFGPQLAKDTLDYVISLGRQPDLFNFLDCLTALTPKGKRLHPVKNWGTESVKKLRFILGLQSSYDIEGYTGEPFVQNLNTLTTGKEYDPLSENYRGMRSAIEAFKVAGQSGITNGKELIFAVERAGASFWFGNDNDYREWAKSLYADDWLKLNHPTIYQQFMEAKK